MKNKVWKEWQKNVVLAAFLLVNARWEVKLKSVKTWKKNDKKKEYENEKASEPLFLWFPKQRQKRASESWTLPQEKKETIFTNLIQMNPTS